MADTQAKEEKMYRVSITLNAKTYQMLEAMAKTGYKGLNKPTTYASDIVRNHVWKNFGKVNEKISVIEKTLKNSN